MSDEEQISESGSDTETVDESFDDESQDTIEPFEDVDETTDVPIHSDMMIENDDTDDEEPTFQKIDELVKTEYLANIHPEEKSINMEEIKALSMVIRDEQQNIIDPLHRTIPVLTKYEFTKILGVRAKQINEGAKPFIEIHEEIIDGYLIAQLELQQKKTPFIIQRPLPGGGCEFWKLTDLEILV